MCDSTGDVISHGSWRKFDCVEKGSGPGCNSSHFRAQNFAGRRSDAPKSSICETLHECLFFAASFRLRKSFANTDLCGDDVELEFLPVVVCLFECLNLVSQGQITNEEDGTNESWWRTSISVHVLIRSRNLLKRICSAGT